jgi:hypothetical protein
MLIIIVIIIIIIIIITLRASLKLNSVVSSFFSTIRPEMSCSFS